MKISEVIKDLAEYISEHSDEELPDNWTIYEENGHAEF